MRSLVAAGNRVPEEMISGPLGLWLGNSRDGRDRRDTDVDGVFRWVQPVIPLLQRFTQILQEK
jgi:hypothetical protein